MTRHYESVSWWYLLTLSANPEDEPRIPRFNPFVFLPAAVCDIIATSVSYVGLTLTSASSYQMLRGALIVCTGLLSIVWLRARIKLFQWSGMILCVAGLAVVGLTDIYFSGDEPGEQSNVIIGDFLCAISQIFVAVQLVSEQKYLRQYNVDPLFAVGIEGIFGIILLCAAMVPMYYIHVPPTFSTNPEHRLEVSEAPERLMEKGVNKSSSDGRKHDLMGIDVQKPPFFSSSRIVFFLQDVLYAFKEIKVQPMILAALGGTTISIAFFNFAGLTVSKNLSATTRTVLDSVRVILIWAAEMPLFGQKFIPLQLIGFALLIAGMFVYNDLVFGPWFRRRVLPKMDTSQCLTK
ncbi:unnamed protein product [Haemonchus placei]|uniref:CRT-like domain-containing protein n=1 Tax=Haemonchus placei TaxID=6290 RepID=A0A0N4X9U8_HAEPC|nr:unnamed protein product [Haemonchus placei]